MTRMERIGTGWKAMAGTPGWWGYTTQGTVGQPQGQGAHAPFAKQRIRPTPRPKTLRKTRYPLPLTVPSKKQTYPPGSPSIIVAETIDPRRNRRRSHAFGQRHLRRMGRRCQNHAISRSRAPCGERPGIWYVTLDPNTAGKCSAEGGANTDKLAKRFRWPGAAAQSSILVD